MAQPVDNRDEPELAVETCNGRSLGEEYLIPPQNSWHSLVYNHDEPELAVETCGGRSLGEYFIRCRK